MPEVYLDLNEVRKFRKGFEPETAWDLFLPRESSAIKIGGNVLLSTFFAGLWAKGWQKFKRLGPGFCLPYLRNAFVFSAIFFPANEMMGVLIPRHFGANNIFLNNSAAGLLTMAAFTLAPRSLFGKNKVMMGKHVLHIFLYSLYFDLSIAIIRDKLLKRHNHMLVFKEITPEERLQLIMSFQKSLDDSEPAKTK